MPHDLEKTFDGKPRTPEQFAWDYAVEVARDPESHRAAWTLSVRRSVILQASDEIDRLTSERDRVVAERDRLIAMWPGSTAHCVYHDPSDGKWRANDGRDLAFETLEAAVRNLTGLDGKDDGGTIR